MFLSNVEPYIIWSNIFHNLEKHSPKDEKSHKEVMKNAFKYLYNLYNHIIYIIESIILIIIHIIDLSII